MNKMSNWTRAERTHSTNKVIYNLVPVSHMIMWSWKAVTDDMRPAYGSPLSEPLESICFGNWSCGICSKRDAFSMINCPQISNIFGNPFKWNKLILGKVSWHITEGIKESIQKKKNNFIPLTTSFISPEAESIIHKVSKLQLKPNYETDPQIT